MVAVFKKDILDQCGEHSLALTIALGEVDLSQQLFDYQESFLPHVALLGLTAPSISDLFDTEITLTIKG